MMDQHRHQLNEMKAERKRAAAAAQGRTRQAMQEQARAQKELAARAASEIAYMRDVEQEMANFKRNAVRQVRCGLPYPVRRTAIAPGRRTVERPPSRSAG